TTAGTGLIYDGTSFSTTLGTSISAGEIADGDHGDFTYSGGVASLDADTVADSEIDYSQVTLADFTNDAGFTNFAYLFPSNATSTTLSFNGGIIAASSTINGNLSITGNATATNATTTNFFASVASSTNLFAANARF